MSYVVYAVTVFPNTVLAGCDDTNFMAIRLIQRLQCSAHKAKISATAGNVVNFQTSYSRKPLEINASAKLKSSSISISILSILFIL